MLQNIGNAITRLPMDRLRRNVDGRIPWSSRHVRHDAVAMAATVDLQRPLRGNGALNIQQLWASGGRTREPISIKFGTQQHVRTRTTVTWLNIKIFKIQNVGKYSKCHNLPNNRPTGTQLGWSHDHRRRLFILSTGAQLNRLWETDLTSTIAIWPLYSEIPVY